MKLSSLKEKKFIVLIKETNDFDEINNFFMNNYWHKIGIFVKLMEKSLTEMEELKRFQGSAFDGFEKKMSRRSRHYSLNSQARFRNYRMKLIVWMIREIFKMLNQYAVDNPTLPVNQCFSHLIQILVEC